MFFVSSRFTNSISSAKILDSVLDIPGDWVRGGVEAILVLFPRKPKSKSLRLDISIVFAEFVFIDTSGTIVSSAKRMVGPDIALSF